MAMNLEQFKKHVEERGIREEQAKKSKQKRLEKFLRKHGEELVEIEEPVISRGKATTINAKITRNKLAKIIDFNSNDAYDKYCRKILMRLRPKKSKK
jgi:hypothetical protein